METIALVVALFAIVASIKSTISSSVRDEVHQQASLIQDLLKDLSSLAHDYHLWTMTEMAGVDEKKIVVVRAQKANAHEALCSMKCDLLESTLGLLARRCSSRFFFDADAKLFKEGYIRLIGSLRDDLSTSCYTVDGYIAILYRIDARLVRLYVDLNEYVGERFRPIFEAKI
ncbi:hypothetical protein WLF14_18880 [Pseudomonas fluorescens]|uniref:hypothetical protein n=1 Tax=Pseudomonas fluorescens TaxID=294 RepID=UPI00313EE47C